MNSEDELRSENMLLKLKLEMEHGMKMMDTSALDPAMENQWLSDIYKFENQFKEAGQVKIYDKIGRPEYKRIEELKKEEITDELDRISDILAKHRISLDCICDYDDEIIYKFVTEELFQCEVDDILVEGMVQHFIYEEFHPNHEYDLKRYATAFIEKLLTRDWVPDWDQSDLATHIMFQGKEYDMKSISIIILAFQETYHPIHIEEQVIEHVDMNIEKNIASVRLRLSYTTKTGNGKTQLNAGKSIINFKMQDEYWRISGFQLPGFGD